MRRAAWAVVAIAVVGGLGHTPPAAAQTPPVAQCAATPLPCVEATRTKFRLDLGRARLKWKWSAGNVVDIRDLANPAIGTAGYDFCVYDAGGALVVAIGVPPATTCNGKPCWRARPYGFQYRDRDGTSFGVTKMTLKAALGRRGDALSVAASGAQLPLPAADPLAPLTGQIVRSDDPANCWSSRSVLR